MTIDNLYPVNEMLQSNRGNTYRISLIVHPKRQLEQPHIHHTDIVLIQVRQLVIIKWNVCIRFRPIYVHDE